MAISIAQLFFFITLSVGFFFFSSFRKVSFISFFFPCSVILCYSLQVFIFQLATLKVYLSVYWAHILAIPVIESEDTKSTYPKEIIKFWELVYRGGVKKCQNMTFKVNFLCQKSQTTDTQWRHKSKISEKLGRFVRQNMLWPYLKLWE